MDDKYLKNWRCGAYRFSHNEKKDYGYQKLKKIFLYRRIASYVLQKGFWNL